MYVGRPYLISDSFVNARDFDDHNITSANYRFYWLVQALITSQIAVACVTEACLFASHAFVCDSGRRAL